MQEMKKDKKPSTLIILAPNGARKMKKDHPSLPISANEIVEEVDKCVNAGAAMVHLHARTHLGEHSLCLEDNLTVYNAVKDRIGDRAIIQLTTEAVGKYAPSDQMKLIEEINPEAASFALMELIPDISCENSAGNFFHSIAKKGTLAQYILYSPEQMKYYLELIARNILPSFNHHILIVLGRYHPDQQSLPSDLDQFLQLITKLDSTRWAICAFGKNELDCLSYAAKLGGDTRVGFENNLFNTQGQLAADNCEQVTQLKNTLLKNGHSLITAKEVRTWVTHTPK
ncbi:3-keto-5-aminohexanoate cleavage protein [Vibrio sp. CAIM 722]|uniref:3-keto-5-aminohexanoate cleavage protein n=1 Tax=Vibrio eleionomae TaxID=2653505 RepID=A0A7X4LLA1_9VIBR|nr:3-keto-5-aminohexanoate cleavage protein [Vibrio eleionomae]MZI93974.1 3-keto-5-aminohexanoate cleavage protein [Vibrio eleionomae]